MRQLDAKYPGEFFSFLQSAAGDVSTRFTRKEQTPAQMEHFGAVMAEEFERLLARPGAVRIDRVSLLTLAIRN